MHELFATSRTTYFLIFLADMALTTKLVNKSLTRIYRKTIDKNTEVESSVP